jgi:hypothetical protein
MCSAVWKINSRGYELGFNRDEKWQRPASLDPRWETAHPVPGACARDGAAGGTWLFTNARGITLAVMNAYPGDIIPPPGQTTRGDIPFHAAASETCTGIETRLLDISWRDYAPCRLLLLAPGEARHYSWNGICFSIIPPPEHNFLTTSSYKCAEVCSIRSARFREISNQPLVGILDDEVADDPAAAIHATRADGGTVSRTVVLVNEQDITFAVRRRSGDYLQIIHKRGP